MRNITLTVNPTVLLLILVTIGIWVYASNYEKQVRGGFLGDLDLVGLFRYGAATIASLVVWLLHAEFGMVE